MTYDAPAVLASFSSEQALDYPLVGDREASVVNELGVRNEEYDAGHRAYGIPHPGILLIDAERRVLLKRAVPGFRERPPFEELYAAVVDLIDE